MKNLFRAAAIVSFLSLASACTPIPVDGIEETANDALSKSFDPVAQFASVKKAALQYTTNIVAVTLSGERQASASATSSSCTSFLWVWTVMGSDGTFVDVQINSQSVKVLKHEHRFLFAGEGTFDASAVLVNGQDLLAISATLGMGQPTAISLSSAFTSEATGPSWDLTFPKSVYVTVDGVTGKATK